MGRNKIPNEEISFLHLRTKTSKVITTCFLKMKNRETFSTVMVMVMVVTPATAVYMKLIIQVTAVITVAATQVIQATATGMEPLTMPIWALVRRPTIMATDTKKTLIGKMMMRISYDACLLVLWCLVCVRYFVIWFVFMCVAQ